MTAGPPGWSISPQAAGPPGRVGGRWQPGIFEPSSQRHPTSHAHNPCPDLGRAPQCASGTAPQEGARRYRPRAGEWQASVQVRGDASSGPGGGELWAWGWEGALCLPSTPGSPDGASALPWRGLRCSFPPPSMPPAWWGPACPLQL